MQHNKQKLEKKLKTFIKLLHVSGLVNTTVLNTKIKVDNKIHDLSVVVNKTDYGSKILETEGKYITATNYNKSTSYLLDAKIIQKISHEI